MKLLAATIIILIAALNLTGCGCEHKGVIETDGEWQCRYLNENNQVVSFRSTNNTQTIDLYDGNEAFMELTMIRGHFIRAKIINRNWLASGCCESEWVETREIDFQIRAACQ
jgi:hypothetical protein